MRARISHVLARSSMGKAKPNRGIMLPVYMCVLAVVDQAFVPAVVRSQTIGGRASQPLLMERQKEVTMALSACPPALANGASVYVLGAAGYVKVRDGRNGFTAIVQHSLPSSQEPQCLDAEATRTFLPRILEVAELRAQGKSREEIGAFMADAGAKGLFQAPAHVGVIYMLSTQNVVPNAKGLAVPFPAHVMFYGTHLSNADLGADSEDLGPDGNPNGTVFVAAERSPYALIIVLPAHAAEGPR